MQPLPLPLPPPTRPERGCRRRWKRFLLAGLAAVALSSAIAAYVGYRIMFQKNPEAVREIRAAEQRQQELDDVFASPPPAGESATP